MKARLVTRTEGVEGTEYYNRSLDDIVTAKARVSSSREVNELFEDGSKLLRHCILNQHWSVFDQAFLGFEVVTCRDMGREILRHYSMNFQELSRRYSSDNLEVEPIELRMQSKSNRQSSTEVFDPVISMATNGDSVQNTLASVLITNKINEVVELYNALIDAGAAKECARRILPGATTTVMEIEGSLRSWITFLNARLHKTAQKEVRLVAEHIRDVFVQQCPVISKALYNFEDSYDIHVLERIVLEKYGFYNMLKDNNYKKFK